MLWCLNLLSVTFRGCSHTQEGRRATPRRESTFVWLGTKTHCGMSSTTPWARTRLYTKDEQRQLSKGLSPHLLPYYACSVTVHLKFCWPRLSPQGSCRATAPDRNSLFLKESCGWAGRVLAYRAWNPGLVTSNNPGMKTHVCNSSTQEGRQRWELKVIFPQLQSLSSTPDWPVKGGTLGTHKQFEMYRSFDPITSLWEISNQRGIQSFMLIAIILKTKLGEYSMSNCTYSDIKT